MKVQVKFTSLYRVRTRIKETQLELPEGSTLYDLLAAVDALTGGSCHTLLYDGEAGRPSPNLLLIVNGVPSARLAGYGTTLKDGDSVAFVPPMAGGSLGSFGGGASVWVLSC